MSRTPRPDSPFLRGVSRLPRIIGHRGTRVHAPENTMAAFCWAADAGADAVELDIRMCGSGELVVVHDQDLARVAGLAWQVVDVPYGELARVDLGQGQRIPLLADALDEMDGRGRLVHVEVKANGQDIDVLNAAVARELLARPSHQRANLCVSSFSQRVLRGLSRSCPGITLATLVEAGSAAPLASLAPLASPDASDADGDQEPRPTSAEGGRDFTTAGVHPDHSLVSREVLSHLRSTGRFVNAWTVNDVATARRLSAAGVDGLITDDVALLRGGM